jgi:hypothetical protein
MQPGAVKLTPTPKRRARWGDAARHATNAAAEAGPSTPRRGAANVDSADAVIAVLPSKFSHAQFPSSHEIFVQYLNFTFVIVLMVRGRNLVPPRHGIVVRAFSAEEKDEGLTARHAAF